MDQSNPLSATTVLVVEDEPLIRMMAVEFVEEAGFEALEAVDGNDALRILEARDDIEILFTDVRMPGGLNGLELAQEVRTRWPSVRILVTSGHMHADDPALPRAGTFVSKPYSLAKVAELLDSLSHPSET